MDSKTATHLSPRFLQTLSNETGKRATFLVQYLEHKKQTVNSKQIFLVHLSDGFFSSDFIVNPPIVENFFQNVLPNDIIEAALLKKDQTSTLLMLCDFKVVFSKVPRVVGKPVLYREGAENPSGNNEIPSEVLRKQTETVTNPQTSTAKPLAEDNKQPSGGYRIESDDENDEQDHYTLIANLNHYDRSFKIRGRIIKKTPIKSFNTKGKEGCVFNIIIKDESQAIQAVFFNEVAKRFYDLMEEGKVFSFADVEIRTATKFNPTDNKFELSINENSDIKRVADIKEISCYHFKFAKISEIEMKSEGENVDLIAIVEDPGALKQIQIKSGETKEKRTIKLRDDSGFSIDITLWGPPAVKTDLHRNSIVIFQGVRVKIYNGKTLTFTQNSQVITKIPENTRFKELLLYKNSNKNSSDNIRNLGDGSGMKENILKISEMEKEIATFSNDSSKQQGSKVYFTIVGHLARILGSLYYESCENDSCMKKVAKNSKGTWDCDKCRKSFAKPKNRFMTTFKFADDTGSFIATASGEDTCKLIFNKSIEELVSMRQNDEKYFIEYLKENLFEEYRVRVSVRKDQYKDDIKLKYQLVQMNAIIENPDLYIPAIQAKIVS